MKILILGGAGQLGRALQDEFQQYDLLVPSREELDITDFNKTKEYIKENDPDYIFSTAAYMDMNKCEEYPNKAFEVNALATKNIAEACKEMVIPFVWISTNYVFSGEKGNYTEVDEPSPINTYGLSKLAGEHLIKQTLDSYYIIRTAGLFGKYPCKGKGGKKNIIDILATVEDLKAKVDEYFTITYAEDLATAIHQLILKKQYGIYHLFNKGRYTVYELAKMIRHDVKKATRAEFDNKANYPIDASLATIKDVKLPPVKDSIRKYLQHTNYELS